MLARRRTWSSTSRKIHKTFLHATINLQLKIKMATHSIAGIYSAWIIVGVKQLQTVLMVRPHATALTKDSCLFRIKLERSEKNKSHHNILLRLRANLFPLLAGQSLLVVLLHYHTYSGTPCIATPCIADTTGRTQ